MILIVLSALPASALAQEPSAPLRSHEESTLEEGGASQLGQSVAISGDGRRAVVGGVLAGVHVFVRTARGWAEEATLRGVEGQFSGASVAISADGSCVVAGAPLDGEGSVWVYRRTGSRWSEEAVLRAGGRGDRLGTSVAISRDGTRIAAGAPAADTAGGSNAGSVRVFGRTVAGWHEEAVLVAQDGARRDQLGWSVGITDDGERVIAGMPGDDCVEGWDCGTARIFTRSASGWSLEGVLVAADGEPGDRLGASVAIAGDGTRAIAGAPEDDVSVWDAGTARVFARTSIGWREEAVLTPEGLTAEGESRTRGMLGSAVAISRDGQRAIVGAPHDQGGGAVHVFGIAGGVWAREGTLRGRRTGREAQLGRSVALDDRGWHAIAGAPLDDTRRRQHAGTARVFAISDRDGEVPWTPIELRMEADRGETARLASAPGTACAPACEHEPDPGEIVVRVDGIDRPATLLLHEPAELRVGRDSRESARTAGVVTLVLGWTTALAIPLLIAASPPCDSSSAPGCEASSIGGGAGVGLGIGVLSTILGMPLALARDEVRLEGRTRSGARVGRTGDGGRAGRVVGELGASLPVLAAGAALVVVLTELAHTVPSGFGGGFGQAFGLGFGIPIGTVATGALTTLIVTGIGSVSQGRGHWLHAIAGFGVGAALGAGVYASFHELAFPGGQRSAAATPLMATGASIALLIAGAGAVVGYELGDASARASEEPFVILPTASISPEGAGIGAMGSF